MGGWWLMIASKPVPGSSSLFRFEECKAVFLAGGRPNDNLTIRHAQPQMGQVLSLFLRKIRLPANRADSPGSLSHQTRRQSGARIRRTARIR